VHVELLEFSDADSIAPPAKWLQRSRDCELPVRKRDAPDAMGAQRTEMPARQSALAENAVGVIKCAIADGSCARPKMASVFASARSMGARALEELRPPPFGRIRSASFLSNA
jgi:hypothetical protein